MATAKCIKASELYNGPVLTEDVSLCLNSIGGLPGAYVKDFL